MLDAGTGRTERIARILRVQADRHTELDQAPPVTSSPWSARRPPASARASARRRRRCSSNRRGHRTGGLRGGRGTRHGDTERLATALGPAGRGGPVADRAERPPDRADRAVRAWENCTWRWRWRRSGASRGLEIGVGTPEVAYRETVGPGVSGLVYRHVKQDGGAGPVRPRRARRGTAATTADFVFRSAVVGGRVPREFVRAVEAGCRDALSEGPLGGHPVTGLGSPSPTGPPTRRTRRSWRSGSPAGSGSGRRCAPA